MAPRARAKSTEDTQAAQDETLSIQDGPDTEGRSLALRDTVVPELYRSDAYSIETLQEATTFEDFTRLAEERFGTIDDVAHVLGDGFTVLRSGEKSKLVGVPLMLLEWNFYPGEYGSNFVAIRLVARQQDGTVAKYILNDGSTGIADMLAEYTKRTGRSGALFARHGLTASEYTYCNECERAVEPTRDTDHRDIPGAHIPAATYYIDTSA